MLSLRRVAFLPIFGAVLALVAIIVVGCTSDDSGDSGGDTGMTGDAGAAAARGGDVQIGTVMPVSGDLSAFGPSAQRSMDLAFELVNEAGGVNGGNISAIHRDSGTNEQIGSDAASGLVNVDGVNVLIGAHSSGVTLAIAESVTIPAGVLHLSVGSSSKAITALDDNDMVFRTRVNDHVKAQAVGSLARALEYQRVATTYINNAYGASLNESFVANFEATGGEVVAAVAHELGQATYISELREASQDAPDVLVVIAYPDSGQILLREAAESEFFDEFMFVDVSRDQGMFDAIGGNHFEGDFGVSPGNPLTTSVEDFRRIYAARTGGDPTQQLISEAFDGAAVIALAIEKAGTDDPVAVRDALREVANPPGEIVGPGSLARALELVRNGDDIDYVGAAGDIDFDENGDVVSGMRVWMIHDNQIVDTDVYAFPGDTIDLSGLR